MGKYAGFICVYTWGCEVEWTGSVSCPVACLDISGSVTRIWVCWLSIVTVIVSEFIRMKSGYLGMYL